MAATPITPVERYYAPEVTKIVIVSTLANKNSPTRAEINGGKEVAGEVSDVNGFNVKGNQLDAPDYGNRFTSKVTGRTEADDSSLKFYQGKTTHDAREIWPRGSTGFVLMMWGGDVPGQLMDVFPFEVSGTPKAIADNAPADLMINFTITAPPVENVVIPA